MFFRFFAGKGMRGFTLVELMVVVAIISVLSMTAIPNFLKFQARAKQTEARINLKAAFTAAKATFSQTNDYSQINAFKAETGKILAPTAFEKNTVYYYYGNCNNTGTDGVPCSKTGCWPNGAVWSGNCNWENYVSTKTAFVYKAFGQIDLDSTVDVWTINDRNVLINAPTDANGNMVGTDTELCNDVVK